MSDFSANLKRLRKRAERSQDSLAEELQVSRQTVSGWERGRSYPDLDMLLRLCDALHATPDQLLYPPEKQTGFRPAGIVPGKGSGEKRRYKGNFCQCLCKKNV